MINASNRTAVLPEIPAIAGRHDLYGRIHKALRKAQCDLLGRLGSADFENASASVRLLGDLRALLVQAAEHVIHEDEHIHAPLAERAAAATLVIDRQHDDHRAAFAELEALIKAVETAAPGRKAAAGRQLYLAFSGYVAEDFEHMLEEETVTMPLLWSLFTDAELMQIEMNIVSSLTPEASMASMRIMIPAMNPDERAAMLAGMKQGAPAEVFNAVMEFAARPNLEADEFADLARRLDLAA